jgi:hypothetical protein
MKTAIVIGLMLILVACLVDVARGRVSASSASSAAKKHPTIDRSIVVDMDLLREIESGGNGAAVSPKGARGPYQMCPAAWLDAQASLRARGRDIECAYAQWVHDETVSRCYAWEYISRVLPRYLTCERLDLDRDFTGPVRDCIDARLAAWNCGAKRVRQAYGQSAANWLRYVPAETREFVSRYHRAEKEKKVRSSETGDRRR